MSGIFDTVILCLLFWLPVTNLYLPLDILLMAKKSVPGRFVPWFYYSELCIYSEIMLSQMNIQAY